MASPATRSFILSPISLLLRLPIITVFTIIAHHSISLSSFSASLALPPEIGDGEQTPTPTPWPEQFHSVLVVNYNGTNQIIDLWYDWPNGRNFNVIQHQLGSLLYDLEWNNGTSFFYTTTATHDDDDYPPQQCRIAHLDVGILRPNWLDGATYLGQRSLDGFLCNVWTKADFIWYYEDLLSHRPVYWLFYTGRAVHVMTFDVGGVLEDAKWQAPIYCFNKAAVEDNTSDPLPEYAVAAAASLKAPVASILRGPMGVLL